MTNINNKFNNIALFIGVNKKNIINEYANISAVLTANNYNVFITASTQDIIKNSSLPTVTNYNNIDIIITIGGDGTMLKAIELAQAHNIPLLGINCGRLGFLTDICGTNQDQLIAILEGNHITEKRTLMEARINIAGQTKDLGFFLNDIILIRGGLPRVLEFDLYIDNQFICNQMADGLVIATPTGSTAYSLSAGGPILEPGVAAITIAPICAHTLNTRPIVINSNKKIAIVANHRDEVTASVSCDGKEQIPLPQNATVHVAESNNYVTLVHPSDYNYFNTLKEKLHWERKPHARLLTD
jgi:NAD+ kinase